MNNKRKIFLVIFIIVVILIIIAGINIYLYKRNKDEIDSSIHAVVIVEDTPFYKKAETDNVKQIRLLKKSENVYILDEFEKDGIDWYKVKVDGKINGYVRAENVLYFEEVNSEKVLVSDVSKFNYKEDFETQEEYEVFLLENKISYVYIRAGGRGYGEEGKMYEDSNYQMFANACEYLGIPYGFYFIDEALNTKEIEEEVDFIKIFLEKNGGEYCKLPVALDIEKHNGNGRADNIWNERSEIVQELIDKLEDEEIDVIVYSNARNS